MNNNINVLIVEDDLLTVDPLLRAFEHISESKSVMDFNIKSVTNCDDAVLEIHKAAKTTPLDLVLLDINLCPSTDKKFLSGEDIGIEIKKFFPDVKIVVLTSHNNNYRLNNILKSLDPVGFLIKSETDFAKLVEALSSVLEDTPYYSKAILQLMRRYFMHDFNLDKIDRQILYHLSKGAKIKDLIEVIRLSKSAIDLRKRNLKELFGVHERDDRELILKAEGYGFI